MNDCIVIAFAQAIEWTKDRLLDLIGRHGYEDLRSWHPQEITIPLVGHGIYCVWFEFECWARREEGSEARLYVTLDPSFLWGRRVVLYRPGHAEFWDGDKDLAGWEGGWIICDGGVMVGTDT